MAWMFQTADVEGVRVDVTGARRGQRWTSLSLGMDVAEGGRGLLSVGCHRHWALTSYPQGVVDGRCSGWRATCTCMRADGRIEHACAWACTSVYVGGCACMSLGQRSRRACWPACSMSGRAPCACRRVDGRLGHARRVGMHSGRACAFDVSAVVRLVRVVGRIGCLCAWARVSAGVRLGERIGGRALWASVSRVESVLTERTS